MSAENLPISQAREQLTQLPEWFDAGNDPVAITKHGKPVMAILPWELYESLLETIDVLQDDVVMQQVMADVKAPEKNLKASKSIASVAQKMAMQQKHQPKKRK